MLDEQRWQAVVARDASQDGQFFLGVRSTGIYCRPSCPARKPRRENVVFFETPDAAEAAGFRACKRCQPRAVVPETPQVEWVERACRLIEADSEGSLDLTTLAQTLGLSPFHVQRVFKKVMGISPRQYAEAYRLGRVKTSLKQEDNVTMAIYEAGYGSSSRFYEGAGDKLGMTPVVYRRGGAGMSIGYSIVTSALGRLLVAATERGVCFVSLGDDDTTLENTLRGDYYAAACYRDDEELGEWVAAILAYLDGQVPHLDLPLDIQGTAFQWRVWEALRAIPYGSTRSYGEIAAMIDDPKAARAVGHACATNPVALVIPCHRAVRHGGQLGGYRWGLDRKEALLATEKAHAVERQAV